MFKKPLQRGRSEQIPEAYSLEYVEGLSDARTKLEGFFNILLRQVFGGRLRWLDHRLREKIPVLTALLSFFFLAVGIEIFFCIRQMTFADVVQALLVEQKRPFIMGRVLIHFRHRQGIDRTGFDAIAAKYALRNIDIEFAGKSLQWKGFIFRTDDLNTMRGTGRFAEITPNATLLSIVISEKTERPAVRVRDRPLLSRVLERNGTMKHVLERDLHRVPYFRKEGGLPDALGKCSDTHRSFHWLEAKDTGRGANHFNSLRLLSALSFTDLPIASCPFKLFGWSPTST
jgi:hypothetical protein